MDSNNNNNNESDTKECKKRNMQNIKKFVNHEKHKCIYFDENRKCFKRIIDEKINKEIKIPGLKQYLNDVFFPDYEYVKQKGDASSGVSNMFEGIERGEIVHEQLMDYFNLNKNDFIKKCPVLHFYTTKTIKSLKEWGMKPMCSEVTIWNENIATRLDGLCRDKLYNLILMEWKTGMDGYFLRGNSDMKGILKGLISNSPLNQSLLQLLISKQIIEKEYTIFIHDQYVIHIHKDGVIPYGIPQKILDIKDDIYIYFMQRVVELKTLKQQIINSNNKKVKKHNNKKHYRKKNVSKKKRFIK